MSISRASHKSPRYSASHGRIVTQNSSLSSALLRENTDGAVVDSLGDTSVDSSALDVVSSSVNVSNTVSNPVSNENVQYVVVSKSRLSLNTIATNSETALSDRQSETGAQSPAYLQETNRDIDSSHEHIVEKTPDYVDPETKVHERHSHNKYAYHSLKSSRHASRSNSQAAVLDNNTHTSQADFEGEGADTHNIGDKLQADLNALTEESNTEVGDFGDGDTAVVANTHDNSLNVNSRSRLSARSAQVKEAHQAGEVAAPEVEQSQPISHDIPARETSLYAHQNTRLSLNSQHDRVSRNRDPVTVDKLDQAIPPLDLSRLSLNKSPVSDPTSPFDTESSSALPTFHKHPQVPDQNLHASVRTSSVVHFSPPDNNPTNRTYEVESPVLSSKLPHVKSSDNFRGQGDTYRQDDLDTFRDREQGPERLEQHQSDLADGLQVPYQFDTQAQLGLNDNYNRPPSPPVQTTPPPTKEPATSLRSNSNVYAVTNPEILRAQGITPPPGAQFTPRQYSNTQSRHSHQQEVKFDAASGRPVSYKDSYGGSPVKDRAPTPYATSPKSEDRRSPGEYPRSPPDWDDHRQGQPQSSRAKPQSRSGSSKRGLPPQHPPLDTKHNKSKPGSSNTSKREDPVKRVYVESPSFTREEEDEYRFVDSRLEDIEEKQTFRAMDSKGGRGPGYGGDDYERAGRADKENHRSRRDENDRSRRDENDRSRRDENDRSRRDENDRSRRDENNYDQDKNRDRYEDRNREMNGYSGQREDRQRDARDRYEDRNEYTRDSDPSERQYNRLQDDRAQYEREPVREEEPDFRRGFQKQNTEVVDQLDLRKEAEYQRDLKKRIDKQKIKMKDTDYVPPAQRDSYERENRDNYNDRENNFVRDSLDFPEEKDTARSYARDSLEYNNYVEQNREWGNPPQNPYQDNQGQYQQGGYAEEGYGQPQGGYAQPQGDYAQAQRGYDQGGFMKQDSKPDFYDPEDAERMEIVNPKLPSYDFVEHNKQDYGLLPKKSYRAIVHKKKEEEEKLDQIFITPKVPSKKHPKQNPKKSQSAQPEHFGYQPPVQDQYPMGFKPSSAEELWAKRSANLSTKKDSAGSSKKGGSASKMPKWNINPKVKQVYKYEAPPSLPPASGQGYKPPPNMSYTNNQVRYSPQEQVGYTTPTRHLQPLENKPAPPTSTELVPTAVNPASPFRRHLELKPITQEIMTEDGQRISVDINLRLISPPPGHSGAGSPTHQQQLALVPVQETQGLERGVGVPYQMQDQYGNYDNGYNAGYQEDPQYEEYQSNQDYSDIEQRILSEEAALNEHGSYAKKYNPGSLTFKEEGATPVDLKTLEEGYATIYNKMKSKDPNDHPWYKVYNLNDYKKMQREVRLNRGTLGPDLDTEPFKEKMEKRHKQFEYARMVMEKNRMELQSKKPPQFPRSPPKMGEENVKRRAALEYARNVPKPAVKPRPNQYNSYEVAAQLTPGAGNSKSQGSTSLSKNSPPPGSSQTMDVIDIRTLEQRHIQERKTADKISRNMDSVLSQKAH